MIICHRGLRFINGTEQRRKDGKMNLITKHKIAKAHADDMRDEIDKNEDPDKYEVEADDDEDK